MLDQQKPAATRSYDEEQQFQIDNGLCGMDFCINPDCYCDEIRGELTELNDEQLREKALSPDTDNDYLFWTAREISEREHDYREDETDFYVLTAAEHQQLAERLVPVFAEKSNAILSRKGDA